MQISLPADLEQFVEEKVKAGQYERADDVVEDGLRLLRHLPEWTNEELRKEIEIGLAQLERGEGKPWSVTEIIAEGQRRLAAKKR